MSYRFNGKQKTLALGVYPDISLKEARLKRDKARLQVSEGIDPSELKKSDKRQKEHGDESKFSTLVLEWWQNQQNRWVEHHAQRVWQRLRDNSFSELDKKSNSRD